MGVCLYVVVPCYNEEVLLRDSAYCLRNKLNDLKKAEIISDSSRIVFVDDGSRDNSYRIMQELHEEDTLFSMISFSRNYGHQNAVMAGYMFAKDKCDAVISIDADLQQDINAIDRFIEKYNEGYEIVYGVRNDRHGDGFFKKVTSQMFYRIMRTFGSETIPNHADYRLLSNNVLNALAEYKECNVFLRGLIPELGFNSCIVNFDVHERQAGTSKYSLRKMLNLALDGITSHSIRPMHMIFAMGCFIVLCAIVNMIYTFVVYCLGETVLGWPTIVISIWFLGGINLMAIGCVGEYVGKTYMEAKKRPRYIIRTIEHYE